MKTTTTETTNTGTKVLYNWEKEGELSAEDVAEFCSPWSKVDGQPASYLEDSDATDGGHLEGSTTFPVSPVTETQRIRAANLYHDDER